VELESESTISAMPENVQKTDVLIAGGGFAGLALAVALRQSLGTSFVVTVADPAFARSGADARASAIAAAARRLLEAISVWQAVADDAQRILDMVVTDSKLQDAMRPVFLTFAGDVVPGEPFAHMIENGPLLAALIDKAKAEGVTLLPSAVEKFDDDAPSAHGTMIVRLANGAIFNTRLLVAADGANSRVRELSGIATHGWSYDQSAIVCTVAHERDHHGCAEEHFLPSGPFAILPLKGNRSSIVWTERMREAARIVALDDAAFHDELEQRFGLKLGEITVAGSRQAFPLGFAVARSFIADRVALIGDAAHMIHPIAGQGLNMGIRDAAALAETIVETARLGLDCGGPDVLEQYQRWRRFDTMTMGVATDGLNRLFSNHSDVLRLVRDIGLGVVDRMPGLKDTFIRQAAGISGDTPRLLRGEAL
jgi:2-octaprenyl-6-methoxyphenol hydroxylase